jgi:phosphoenolpyruvate carboxykinase (GTP)
MSFTQHAELNRWIQEIAALCKPEDVHVCDGSDAEWRMLAQELVAHHSTIPLNPSKRPGSYWFRSTPDDVARTESVTFICSPEKKDAGPTNHWYDPEKMRAKLHEKFGGCMRGRTLYVIPYCMGPLASPFRVFGVELTDSRYVVMNMRIMTRMGSTVLAAMGKERFVPGVHSVGYPLEKKQQDVLWPTNPKGKIVAHFPKEREIWSYGSGYGGNALLGKKCLALRIASVLARDEGWLAEHMLIMSITNPKGEKHYFAAAFPSACGKTNLAMLQSLLPGWSVQTVGDDIAWIRIGTDGRLWAINPEAGFFGVAPGTSFQSNPMIMRTIERNTIFTNVALTDDHDVWWEGMTEKPPEHLTDWQGQSWNPGCSTSAAHRNSRFTVSSSQCPGLDPHWEASQGVPLSGIIFGGRRATTIPLVREARDWQQGVLFGATVTSELTAAQEGEFGKVRHDPFAMLPFCGYNMADYFAHWLHIGKKTSPKKLPKIFYVNWFRRDIRGDFLWPGFSENMRVMKWCFERILGSAKASLTPIGYIPTQDALESRGLALKGGAMRELLACDPKAWQTEIADSRKYFEGFGDQFPKELYQELERMETLLRT